MQPSLMSPSTKANKYDYRTDYQGMALPVANYRYKTRLEKWYSRHGRKPDEQDKRVIRDEVIQYVAKEVSPDLARQVAQDEQFAGFEKTPAGLEGRVSALSPTSADSEVDAKQVRIRDSATAPVLRPRGSMVDLGEVVTIFSSEVKDKAVGAETPLVALTGEEEEDCFSPTGDDELSIEAMTRHSTLPDLVLVDSSASHVPAAVAVEEEQEQEEEVVEEEEAQAPPRKRQRPTGASQQTEVV